MRVLSAIRVRESKHTRRGRLPAQQKRKSDGGSARRLSGGANGRERVWPSSSSRKIVPRKIVHLSFSSSARRGSRTTTARLHAPSKAAGGRRDFMFTNFSKPGNDALETSRPTSSCTESAHRYRAYPSPRRGGTRRATLFTATDRERAGTPRSPRGGFYRSRDRRHARFRRPTSPPTAESGRERGRRDDEEYRPASRRRVTSTGFARNCSSRSDRSESFFPR